MLVDRVSRIVGLTGDQILDDGLEFEVLKLDGGAVTVELHVSSSACAECIVPNETLSRILLTQIQKKFPVVHTVEVVRRQAVEGAAQ